MGLRVPQNQIVTSKYTAGKEYMFVSTYREYKGYYYELNGKLFAGKEFNPNNVELMKLNSDNVNKLRTNPSTYLYGTISNVVLNKTTKIASIPFTGAVTRYFAKKINLDPIIIKEISKETFEQTQSDPLYQTLIVENSSSLTDKQLDNLDKKMPGIKAYLSTDDLRTSGDETNSPL
jgi:hypothetical protein